MNNIVWKNWFIPSRGREIPSNCRIVIHGFLPIKCPHSKRYSRIVKNRHGGIRFKIDTLVCNVNAMMMPGGSLRCRVLNGSIHLRTGSPNYNLRNRISRSLHKPSISKKTIIGIYRGYGAYPIYLGKSSGIYFIIIFP